MLVTVCDDFEGFLSIPGEKKAFFFFSLSYVGGLCRKPAAINPCTAVLPCHADKEEYFLI